MDYIEVSGKNVDEGLTNALIKLETTSDKVEYEVIEKGSAGFLGMGRKLAVIKVRKKEDKPVEANVKAKETETQKKNEAAKQKAKNKAAASANKKQGIALQNAAEISVTTQNELRAALKNDAVQTINIEGSFTYTYEVETDTKNTIILSLIASTYSFCPNVLGLIGLPAIVLHTVSESISISESAFSSNDCAIE